jgi:hypothetical protein
MRLASNWKDILKKAWSIKFIAIAALLSAGEAAVSFLPAVFPMVSSGVLALATMGICFAAFVARIIAQQGVTND